MNDDCELLRRYAENGSQADFTALVQRHFDLVYSAALRQLRGDHHRAREVAQTVFVAAARKARVLAGHPAFVGWLYTSTHFAAQKLIRSDRHRQEREAAASAMHDVSSSSAEAWDRLRPYLDAEMLVLGPTDREAILLRFFGQRPFAEVGAELGLSENTARMRVDRALEKLRQRLARRGVTSSVVALGAALAGNAVAAAPIGLSAAVAGSTLAEVGALAVGASGGSAAFLHLMATKLTFGAVAACGLLALGTGVYYRGQWRASQLSLLEMNRDCARLEASLAGLPGQKAAAEGRVAALQAAPPRPAVPPDAAAAARALLNQEVAENPELRRALGRGLLAEFRLKYGPLAQSLGLPEAQFKQLAILDLKMRSDLFDLEQASRLMGKDPATDANLAPLEQKVRDGHAAAVLSLVGPADAQQIQDYDRTYAARDVANQVAAGSFYSETPLTSGQADQLTQLLTNSSAAGQQGGALDAPAIDWDRVLAAAPGMLAPAQLSALQAVRAKQQLEQLADAAEAAQGGDAMNRLYLGLSAVGAAAILAIGFALNEGRKAAAAHALELSLAARQAELSARFRAEEHALHDAERRQSDLQRAAEASADSLTAGAMPAVPPPAPPESFRAWLATHPAARRQYLKAFHDGIDTTWGLLFQSLHLTPAQIAQVTDLLAQREDNDLTVKAAELAQGLDASAPSIQALDDQLDDANKAAIKAAVGKADYAEIHDYMHEQEIVPFVDELAGNVSGTDAPLTAEQAMQLTTALAGSSQKTDTGRVVPNTVNWDQAMASAQTILSPTQFSVFSTIRDQAQTQQQIRQLKMTLSPPTP